MSEEMNSSLQLISAETANNAVVTLDIRDILSQLGIEQSKWHAYSQPNGSTVERIAKALELVYA